MSVACRNCGDPVDPRRVALGYDYCLKSECHDRCIERVRLAAVGVNKAADFIARAEELVGPPGPAVTATPDDLPEEVTVQPPAPHKGRTTTTLDRLHEQKAVLEAALEDSYQRFCRAEITGAELDRERQRLIRAFNQLVMAENIRYRGMLRK